MKKWLGYFMVVIAIVPVAVFLGIHEIAFFTKTFGAEDQAMAPLGYMLTGGGVFVWIGILLWNSKTGMQRAISFIMIGVCVIGSLGTALFNIYTETMFDAGFSLTENEIKSMTLLIGVVAILHMLALIMELAGDTIVRAWSDDDKDGIPNWLDKKDNRQQNQQKPQQPQNQPRRVYASEAEEVAELEKRLAELSPKANAGSQSDRTPRKDNSQNS